MSFATMIHVKLKNNVAIAVTGIFVVHGISLTSLVTVAGDPRL